MHRILPPSTPTNPIKLAKTHTHAINHSGFYPPYQYFSSISLSYFLGLRTLHTACTHCSPCSFLGPFNQSQQATFIAFLHLMLHQASWLAGTAELLCAPLTVCGFIFWFVCCFFLNRKMQDANCGCLCTEGHEHTNSVYTYKNSSAIRKTAFLLWLPHFIKHKKN